MKIRTAVLTALLLAMLTGAAFAAPILSCGAEGHDVLVLQKNLAAAGYNVEKVDGVFGYATYRAVIAFQRDAKLKITGTVDRSTWNALKKRAQAAPKIPAPVAKPVQKESPHARDGIVSAVTANKNAGDFLISGNMAGKIISTAKKYSGTRYQFGGTTPKGFDCSGFIQYVFRENGYAIARTADEQYKLGRPARNRSELAAGDLVFFTTYESGASHCGIYLGKNQFIHVSSSKGVRVDSLDDPYWKPRWYGGKRIVSG